MLFSKNILPSQAGRVAIVTGATGGLGFECAQALAGAGATVVVAGRNPQKGQDAVARIRQAHPTAAVAFSLLDLASLESVSAFAAATEASHGVIDLLINNAGVMAVPTRHDTRDGFELQFGTNYLGHFALTGRLLPLLRRSRSARLVNVASLAHLRGRIDFADPQGRRRYHPWKAYSQSKLAMLMFGTEFQRRSAALGWGVIGVSAHPGWAQTEIFSNGPTLGGASGWKERIGMLAFPVFGQSAVAGARPILHAATAPRIQAGGYYGPDGYYELKGAPKAARIAPQARNVDAAARLWDLSVDLTGVDPRVFAARDSAAAGVP
ncbi:oxidoreductase [Lichenihabitans sp. Uapishka_5]|uniref:oxidoreductase n=1 Tax=Lichenihabitans sp. Uapishka_5 TaxID=3037302 RepID=UPI0029E829D4|nr:oxidoreductase [Lichenihabitans sp. Uapishka_5]MDX7949598.1 oxidoreductase [Lichenihabitans sp. Uapishka_5]